MSDAGPLGEYLRARRAEVGPENHGLPRGSSRRVPGLRREEVADLAGVSLDYYTRLEQGRDRRPSQSVLEALSQALLLDVHGLAHLGRLTGHGGLILGGQPTGGARPGVVALMDQWDAQVCLLLSPYRDVVASNALARAVNPSFEVGRNTLREVFTDPAAPARYPDWDQVARQGVAALRASVGSAKHDPVRDRLVGELSALSPVFARLWARHDAREKPAGTQRFHVASVGTVELEYEPLVVPYSGGQILYVFFAREGSQDARLLARIGSEVG